MTTQTQAPLIGIDLGTTYSLVSVLQDGVPVVLPNALGERLMPSAVSWTSMTTCWWARPRMHEL
jgi:molecular chaperone HscC